jgi:hypothetical protein
MTAPTPAYQYGRVLGELQEGIRRMFAAIAKGMEDVRIAHLSNPTEGSREALSKMRYQQAIDRERRIGRAYVKSQTDALAKRWGL